MIKFAKVVLFCANKHINYRSSLPIISVQYSTLKHSHGSVIVNKRGKNLRKSPNVYPKFVVIKEEDLIGYITSGKRNIEELLNIDIRNFPAEHRLTCLEAIIQTARLNHNLTLREQSNFPLAPSPVNNNHFNSISFDRFTEVSAISLGIDPTSTAAMGFLPPLNTSVIGEDRKDELFWWLMDERFKLLLLSNVAGAKDLPRPRLLVLAACLRQMPPSSSQSKALASVLRLITLQINEASPSELVYISSLLSGLPRQPSTNSKNDASKTLTVLSVEADLMRDALRRHLMNRLPEMESLGLMPLLRLGYDFGAELTFTTTTSSFSDRLRFLGVLESVFSTRPKEQNLYTTCLLYATMQRMNTVRPGLINRGLGQIRRKLHLTSNYPLTDQSAWLSGSLAALANLSVGGPYVSSPSFNISQLSRLPIEMHFLSKVEERKESRNDSISKTKGDVVDGFRSFCGEPGLDMHQLLRSDWVRQLLFDVGDYVADRTEASVVATRYPENVLREKTSGGNTVGGALAALRSCLALLSLGVRHEKLIGVCTRHGLTTTDFPAFVNLHLTRASDLLLSKQTQLSTLDSPFVWTDLVHLLPRVDWQMYYQLAFMQTSNNMSSNFNDIQKSLFHDYISLKQNAVESFIAQIQSRLAPSAGIEIFPFHLIEIDSGHHLFADIIIRKQSSLCPTISKYVLCFLSWQRDVLVSAPMENLTSTFSKNTSIPILPFIYCDWLGSSDKNRMRDEFLKRVGGVLMESEGVPTATTRVHPIRKFIGSA